jgi:hypothetical protein
MAGVRGMLGNILVTSKEIRVCVSGMMMFSSLLLRCKESLTWCLLFSVRGVRIPVM